MPNYLKLLDPKFKSLIAKLSISREQTQNEDHFSVSEMNAIRALAFKLEAAHWQPMGQKQQTGSWPARCLKFL